MHNHQSWPRYPVIRTGEKGLLHLPLKNHGEGVFPVDSSLACFEQQAGLSRMHRDKRLQIAIEYKDL